LAKFLVINQPPSPVPKRSAVSQCVTYFFNLQLEGKARVEPIVGLKGYASLIETDSHEELLDLLKGNPMATIERYTVIPLADFDG